MAPIRNAIDLLRLLDDGKNPRVRRAIDILDRQSSQLKRLLDDLLDVSRIVRGKVKLECRPVELREVVQQAAEAVGGRMAECRHRFEVALPPGGILVDGDPVRLSQILLNLLLNAASYTADGGHVRLLAEWDDSRAVVRVLDNGRGIPPEQREALFEAFTQGRNGPGSTRSGGLGLGLAIARGLAEMHGGELRVESNWPQRGSEFSLHLPRRTGAAAVTDPTSTASADRRDALSILVVEDNADVAEALSVLLQALGHQVRTAASGADALRLATASCPRLAFLDIGLPDIDGLDLARRLREHFPDPHRLYLVALTGYGHAEARERSLAAGFDEHLAKPIDLQTLQALLARLH
jgi:CheY-like chemotaxis protein